MAVEFAVHEIAAPYLRAWYRRLSRNRRGSSDLARAYFEFLETELIRTAGRPEGVRVADWVHPELNVWEFQAREAWVAFAVARRGGWWTRLFRQATIQVVLMAIFDHLPLRAELELLARAVTSWDQTSSA